MAALKAECASVVARGRQIETEAAPIKVPGGIARRRHGQRAGDSVADRADDVLQSAGYRAHGRRIGEALNLAVNRAKGRAIVPALASIDARDLA